jgi:DNA-directed RNA polymerase specialized sigma subunit
MEFVPSQAQGHLIAAAIRVLSHIHKRPPTEGEIADLLGISREVTLHILRGLETRGIVRPLKNPFDVRYDLDDHLLLEELPAKAEGPDMGKEIEDFHRKTEDRQKAIERMMRESDPERKVRDKVSKIEEDFRRFRTKRRTGTPFDDAAEDDDKS